MHFSFHIDTDFWKTRIYANQGRITLKTSQSERQAKGQGMPCIQFHMDAGFIDGCLLIPDVTFETESDNLRHNAHIVGFDLYNFENHSSAYKKLVPPPVCG